MSTADLSLLHQALDLLEEREAELLVWGDTDGAFTHADIISLFTRHLPYEDAESLLAELQKAAMLFSVPTSKGELATARVWQKRYACSATSVNGSAINRFSKPGRLSPTTVSSVARATIRSVNFRRKRC